MKFQSLIPFGILLVCSASLQAQDSSWQYTNGNLPYRFYSGNGTKTLRAEGVVKIHVRQQLNDSVVFDSRKNLLPVYVPARSNGQTYDVNEIFLMPLKAGDSIETFQLMDSFINRSPDLMSRFKREDKVLTFIKVLDVFERMESAQADEQSEKALLAAGETAALEAWLKEKNITVAKKGSGVYIRFLKKGNGKIAAAKGATVSVAYKGTNTDGQQFDSNIDAAGKLTTPLQFHIGKGEMIQGFDEGVAGLKQGDKVVLYIPSMLGYGATPPSPEIKPFQTLVFEVEVLSIRPAAVVKKPAPSGKAPVKKPVNKTTPVKKN